MVTLALVMAAAAAACSPGTGDDPAGVAPSAHPAPTGARSAAIRAPAPRAAASSTSPPDTRLVTTGADAWSTFGASLAISGDVLIAGAPGDPLISPTVYSGAAYVFLHDAATGTWTQQATLAPGDLTTNSGFGVAVAIDGDTVAVAMPSALFGGVPQDPAVYVFRRDTGGAGAWGQVARIHDALIAAGGATLTSIALAGDLIAVGAATSSGSGLVLVFERDRDGTDAWGQIAAITAGDVTGGAVPGEAFGGAVALDGDDLLIGAPPSDSFVGNDGSADLFVRDPDNRDTWNYTARFTAPGGAVNRGFGRPLALQGDTAIVGAPAAASPAGASHAGAAYVFRRDASAGTWSEVAALGPIDPAIADAFGAAIALAGDTAVIGAPNKSVGLSSEQGAAYVFRRGSASSDVWDQTDKLTASDGALLDRLGTAVALNDPFVIVGAPNHEDPGEPQFDDEFGAAYLFDTTPPPPPACQPAQPTSDTLSDGGTLTTPSGVALSAPTGTLPAPLPVWLTEATAPPAGAPALTGETVLGSYVNFGAECTASTNPGTSLTLTFPVPTSADPAQLGVAVLLPNSLVLDGAKLGASWDIVDGVYDADRGVLVFAIDMVASQGMTFALVQHDATAPAITARRGAATAADDDGCSDPPTFEVTCRTQGVGCPAADVAQDLADAYTAFQADGFPEPRLFKDGCNVTRIFVYNNTAPACTVDTSGELRVPAMYTAPTRSIRVCVDPARAFTSDQLRHYLRHELFHAVQFAYPAVDPSLYLGPVNNPAPDRWVLESMAEVAVDSGTTVQRVNDPTTVLRSAGDSLTSAQGLLPYQAQDFWVYVFNATAGGVRRSYPLIQLGDFLDAGARTASVADVMQHPPEGHYRPLGDEYWAWAKNQVIEKTDVTFGGALSSPCAPERKRIARPFGAMTFPDTTSIDGHFEDTLQTTAVTIKFRNALHRATINASGDSLAYKVYVAGDAHCVAVPDGPRTLTSIPKGAEVLVLLGNQSYSTVGEFEVSVFAE